MGGDGTSPSRLITANEQTPCRIVAPHSASCNFQHTLSLRGELAFPRVQRAWCRFWRWPAAFLPTTPSSPPPSPRQNNVHTGNALNTKQIGRETQERLTRYLQHLVNYPKYKVLSERIYICCQASLANPLKTNFCQIGSGWASAVNNGDFILVS